MKRLAFLVGRILLLVYLGVLLMLMMFERFLVYPAPSATEGNWHSDRFGAEDVNFVSEDGTKLHGWYYSHPEPKAHVLFCHGNGEHLGFMGTEMMEFSNSLGVSVFVFDYRGYGQSEGKPAEAGILADAVAAQRWLAERGQIEPNQVVLHGRSLGGGVAVYLASKLGARALVLERTFHSMVEIGEAQYPWLPIRWVMRNRYPSGDRIRDYDGPLLQLHGTADTLVPLSSARQLFDASPSVKKQFIEVPGMGHNDLPPAEFLPAVRELLDSV